MIKLAGREYPYRYQDVRHTLLVLLTYLNGMYNTNDEATKVAEQFLQQMSIGTTMLFGLADDRNGRIGTSDATRQHPQVAAALAFVIRNHLMITNAVAVRLSHGARRHGELRSAGSSVLHWWLPSALTDPTFHLYIGLFGSPVWSSAQTVNRGWQRTACTEREMVLDTLTSRSDLPDTWSGSGEVPITR